MPRASRRKRPVSASSARRAPEPGTPAYQQRLAELWWRQELAERESPMRRLWFAQLSAALGIRPPALAALGLAADATEADVRRAYRRLALECHPDRGGSAKAFRELTESYRAALRVVAGASP